VADLAGAPSAGRGGQDGTPGRVPEGVVGPRLARSGVTPAYRPVRSFSSVRPSSYRPTSRTTRPPASRAKATRK